MIKYIRTLLLVLTSAGLATPSTGSAQSVDTPYEKEAIATKRVPPVMPSNAETSGYCCMIFDVSKSGIPENIRASYCTDAVFTEASKEAVSNWSFSPAEKNGKPVKQWNADTMMSFHLTNRFGVMVPSSTGYLSLRPDRKLTPPPQNDWDAYSEWIEQTYVTEQPCGDLLS
tara:strand:+ start:120 stop:632 length:513 start_codon:yes stop_codon:yes gene_type:complete